MLQTREATGYDIDIDAFEAGHGPCVVLIHGLGDDHRAWRRVFGLLILKHRVVAYDLRGHSSTGLGDARGCVGQLATDLVTLLDALSIERATLAGFSLGGTIAMRAAIDTPERVSALALVATSSRVNNAARRWYEERVKLVDEMADDLRTTLDQDTRDVYANRPAEVAAGLLIRRQATADPAGYANACRAMVSLNERPLDDELATILVPTVVLAGDADQHCPPRAAQIIADRIAGSRVQVLADAGHPLPVERPDVVCEAIAAVAANRRNRD